MRSRLTPFALCSYLAIVLLSCTSKPSSNSATDTSNTSTTGGGGAAAQAQKPPLIVSAGTTITVRLAAALGSRFSAPGQSFAGTVAKDVYVESTVAIPQGANVAGTVVDARPLGKFAGGAVLLIRLDSINVNGSDVPVEAHARRFFAKGKGKRTGIMAGGGAALGGIIGGLAGGGKGAATGMVAGGSAGGAGSAFTANKDIVLPAEYAVSFQLKQAVEIAQ